VAVIFRVPSGAGVRRNMMDVAVCTRRVILPLSICLFLILWADTAVPQSTKSGLPTPLPANPALSTPAPTPPSAIGPPMTTLAPLSPLSPQLTTIPLTGGSVRTDKLQSPSPLSTSPSESVQSTAGGGGRTLEDCIKFWDRGTHMTKSEWRAACQRSQHRLDNLEIDKLTLGVPDNTTTKPRARQR
jgi:hypothetical protein